MYYSGYDSTILGFLLDNDSELLLDILYKCKKSWFFEHYIEWKDEFGVIQKKRVPGFERYKSEEFAVFLESKLGIKLKPKQKITIDNVFESSYYEADGIKYSEISQEAKSHRGYVSHNVCNTKEEYLRVCFRHDLEKIPKTNKRGQKTPDFLLKIVDEDIPDITIEVYSTTNGNIRNRIKETLKHGDSKELGKRYFEKQYHLDDSRIKCAALVVDDLDFKYFMSDELIKDIKAMDTQMDFLLIYNCDVCNQHRRLYVVNITGNDVPDVFNGDAIDLIIV